MSGLLHMDLWVLFWITLLAWIQTGAVGSYFMSDSSDSVFYWIGDLNLIISVPHDGAQTPDSIPDRHAGCYDDLAGGCRYTHACEEMDPHERRCQVRTEREQHTLDIAGEIRNEVERLTKLKAHMVVNMLNRSKMDADEDIRQGAFDETEAVHAYYNYTVFLHMAMAAVGKTSLGRGILLDIHGHTHTDTLVHLGYGIHGDDLQQGNFSYLDSTIAALGNRECGPDVTCFRDVICGEGSLGHYLSDEGFRVVPSPQIPYPAPTVPFRASGYTTEMYGSRTRGDIDAVRIGIPQATRFGERQPFAAGLGRAVVAFMRTHDYL